MQFALCTNSSCLICFTDHVAYIVVEQKQLIQYEVTLCVSVYELEVLNEMI